VKKEPQASQGSVTKWKTASQEEIKEREILSNKFRENSIGEAKRTAGC